MDDHEASSRREGLETAIREKYCRVAVDPTGLFAYPTGREGALQLGYQAPWLEILPFELLQRFVGVGNPFELRIPRSGEQLLDVGSGAGVDVLLAAHWVEPSGTAVGLDLTPELLKLARKFAEQAGFDNVRFEEGSAESLPFASASFDQVISNGALNLVVDKDRAFREIARVLRPGGTLAVADILVVDSVPDDVLADMDAWST